MYRQDLYARAYSRNRCSVQQVELHSAEFGKRIPLQSATNDWSSG